MSAETLEVSVELPVEDVFETGELRLWEHPDGWVGFALEDGCYYHVDERLPEDDWRRRVPVSQRAVRYAISRHIANEDAGGVGSFVRGASPDSVAEPPGGESA